MSVYSNVQTGPKTQFGGEKNGLLSAEYQVGIADIVNIVPSTPTSWQKTIQRVTLTISFILYQYGIKKAKVQIKEIFLCG